MNTFALGRLIVFAILIPLAIFLGYVVATPESFLSVSVVGLVLGVLCLPIVLRWHHVLLIVSWNAYINVFFLPGKPQLWLFLAFVSFGVSMLKRALIPNFRFLSVRPLTISLVFLAVVTVVTAYTRGGIGIQALGGSSVGGKGYIFILGAIVGCFALMAHRVPKDKAHLLVSLFFVGSITAAISNLAYFGGPAFYFLYLIFPVDLAFNQALADYSGPQTISRLVGFAQVAIGVCCWLLARYGLKGTFNLRHAWRVCLLFGTLGIGLLSGFRSAVLIVLFLLVVTFFLEGLHRTRALAVVAALLLLGLGLLPFTSKLPLAVQRSLSFLPVSIDPAVKQDAIASSEWRLQMWQAVLPQVPEYFWLGKGYSLDPVALYLAQEAMRRGLAEDYQAALQAGDYHNGPLSLMIPFGVWGLVGFGTFLWIGFWLLYRNYRYGDPALATINTFLLAFFCMRTFFFVFIYGAFSSEIFLFTGVVGLSVSVNGGVSARTKRVAVETPAKSKRLVAAHV